MTPEERKSLYRGDCVEFKNKKAKMISHQFIKTDGFEKTIAFVSMLTETIWKTMREKKRFCMVLEYDTEALNVNIDYLEETTGDSDDSHLGSQ